MVTLKSARIIAIDMPEFTMMTKKPERDFSRILKIPVDL